MKQALNYNFLYLMTF